MHVIMSAVDVRLKLNEELPMTQENSKSAINNASASAITTNDREFFYFHEVRRYFGYELPSGRRVSASIRTIRKMMAEGLKSSKLGNRLIFYKDDVRQFLQDKRSETATA